LTYDYDTLNTVHTIGIKLGQLNILTKIPGGKNIQGKGIEPYIGISLPSDSLILNAFEFEAFAFIRKSNDSTMICAAKEYYENNDPPIKRFYVGNENTELNFIITPRSFTYDNWYKIRVIWEQKINNKIALVESFMTDFITYNNNDPKIYILFQNYPNPFNPSTTIQFDIIKSSHVKLIIYDMLGRKITTLVNENRKAGSYRVEWNSTGYPSGVYFCKLITDEFTDVKKMVFLK